MSYIHKTESEWIGVSIGCYEVISKIGEETRLDSEGYTRINDKLMVKCNACNISKTILASSLRNKNPMCKGCSRKKIQIGLKIGQLTVESLDRKRNKNGRSILIAICRCDCGNSHTVHSQTLLYGESNSCKNCRKTGRFIMSKKRNGLKRYFHNMISNNRKRKKEFKITLQDLESLWNNSNKLCVLSNLPVSFDDGTASVDRIDSSKGYTIDNIQIVHRVINYMKVDLPEKDFIFYCQSVATAKQLS